MSESEQAQAIAEIKERHKIDVDAYNTTRVILDMTALLKIVDSQAQKIGRYENTMVDLARKSAEQAKEIDRLRQEHSSYRQTTGE